MPLTRNDAYNTPRPDVFELVPPSALRVLDVGCSRGELGASLKRANRDREVIGIEMNQDYCTTAVGQLDSAICADLNSFDWDTLSKQVAFDCIIFADVLEHLADPLRHLKGAASCLSSNGTVVLSLPNIRHISAFYSIFLCGTFPQRERGLFDSTHVHWFTYRDAVKLLESAGYIIDSQSFNIRVRDRGNGKLNKIARYLLEPIANWGPVHEVLAYQFCLRARLRPI